MSGDNGLLDLFLTEVSAHVATLEAGLLAIERQNGHAGDVPPDLDSLMRAAHSLKGAARIVNLRRAADLAHAMEDLLSPAATKRKPLPARAIDVLLRATDWFSVLANGNRANLGINAFEEAQAATIDGLLAALRNADAPAPGAPATAPAAPPVASSHQRAPLEPPAPTPPPNPTRQTGDHPVVAAEKTDRVLRLTAADVDRLLGLASDALIQSRRLGPFAESLRVATNRQTQLSRTLTDLEQALRDDSPRARVETLLAGAKAQNEILSREMAERAHECETYSRQLDDSTSRLRDDVVASRMRPFADVMTGFPRLVRDLARTLGKRVRLEIVGETTRVDRDILDRLEAPLSHIVRNALDHGMETAAARLAAGKAEEGTLRIEARHAAGMLIINISDDGHGINLDRLRQRVLDGQLATPEMLARFTTAELLDFIFLPGLSTADKVTDVSGRGVGLDVVQTTMQELGGAVRVSTTAGRGTRFTLQLPISLSVVRALVVEIAGEPYAFPLGRLDRLVEISRDSITTLEGRPYFTLDQQPIGLIPASSILELGEAPASGGELRIVVLSDRGLRYGLIVDRFLGEHDLVVRRIDPRLGKIRDINAAAVLQDGTPLLIVDVDDLCRSIEKRLSGDDARMPVRTSGNAPATRPRKRILIVDDSITVREVERQLLANRGYEVATAVDGVDGWNTVRNGRFDLVISDIDMPRMNGIELVRSIKQDQRLGALPIVIVSYKDREEDRLLGLEAGANSYLTKSSFHDETLLQTVETLIGAADS